MSFEILGLGEFGAALVNIDRRLDGATKRAIERGAAEVEAIAKENAGGEPGPEVKTGTLRRGIRHTPVHRQGAIGWQSEVGPTVIYSRRIELGFFGEDSLGRIYAQEPRPYFEPAWNGHRLLAIYVEEWRRALTGV